VAKRAEIIANDQEDGALSATIQSSSGVIVIKRDHHAADALDDVQIGVFPKERPSLREKRLAIERSALGARGHIGRQASSEAPGREFVMLSKVGASPSAARITPASLDSASPSSKPEITGLAAATLRPRALFGISAAVT